MRGLADRSHRHAVDVHGPFWRPLHQKQGLVVQDIRPGVSRRGRSRRGGCRFRLRDREATPRRLREHAVERQHEDSEAFGLEQVERQQNGWLVKAGEDGRLARQRIPVGLLDGREAKGAEATEAGFAYRNGSRREPAQSLRLRRSKERLAG